MFTMALICRQRYLREPPARSAKKFPDDHNQDHNGSTQVSVR